MGRYSVYSMRHTPIVQRRHGHQGKKRTPKAVYSFAAHSARFFFAQSCCGCVCLILFLQEAAVNNVNVIVTHRVRLLTASHFIMDVLLAVCAGVR